MEFNFLRLHTFIFQILIIIYLTIGSIIIIPFQEYLRWILLFLLLFYGFFINYLKNEKIKNLKSGYYFILLFGFMLLSLLWIQPNILLYSFSRSLSFILLILSIYFLVNYKNKKENFKIWGNLSFLLNIFMIINLIMFFWDSGKIGEFQGIYNNKNLLASLSGYSLAMSIYFKESNTKLFYLFLLSNSFILIATGSRTALIFLSVVLGFYYLRIMFNNLKRKKYLIIMFNFLLIFLFLSLFDLNSIPAYERLTDTQSYTDGGSTGFSRSQVWKSALPIIGDKPLLGWGYGSSSYYTYIENTTIHSFWKIHNSYINLFMELGFIGVVLLFFLLFSSFKKTFLLVKKDWYDEKNISIFLTFIVGLLNGVSESFMFSIGNPMSLPFWISVILISHLYFIEINKSYNLEINN